MYISDRNKLHSLKLIYRLIENSKKFMNTSSE